jgi:hypothetical protein
MRTRPRSPRDLQTQEKEVVRVLAHSLSSTATPVSLWHRRFLPRLLPQALFPARALTSHPA